LTRSWTGFNLSVEILMVQATGRKRNRYTSMSFQSLSRDSDGSSEHDSSKEADQLAVSISQSRFWWFKHVYRKGETRWARSFNLSVEILMVQADIISRRYEMALVFQSLSRDSDGSSPTRCDNTRSALTFQSLSRDSDGSSSWMISCPSVLARVSISQSRFWWFKPQFLQTWWGFSTCFNLSVEILMVQALKLGQIVLAGRVFQSLSRDSDGSSPLYKKCKDAFQHVSISQSRFWWFKLYHRI